MSGSTRSFVRETTVDKLLEGNGSRLTVRDASAKNIFPDYVTVGTERREVLTWMYRPQNVQNGFPPYSTKRVSNSSTIACVIN